jgi:hypothetical protein
MVWLMNDSRAGWPVEDPDGLVVRFTSMDLRPRADEYLPVLEGTRIRLEPLREEHVEALCEIGLDPDISRLMPKRLETRDRHSVYFSITREDWPQVETRLEGMLGERST